MIEILILYLLSDRELTMYAIQKHIVDYFGAYTQPSFGAIKPALNRLIDSESIRFRKAMSDGGKLSCFYSITQKGKEELTKLLLDNLSSNPIQFYTTAEIKLSCASALDKDGRKALFSQLKTKALEHKFNAENTLSNQNSLSFYQRIVLDNSICQYKNLINFIENLEKENEKN